MVRATKAVILGRGEASRERGRPARFKARGTRALRPSRAAADQILPGFRDTGDSNRASRRAGNDKRGYTERIDRAQMVKLSCKEPRFRGNRAPNAEGDVGGAPRSES